MKISKKLLISAPVWVATMCLGIGSANGQTPSTPDSSTATAPAASAATSGTSLKYMDKRFVTKVAEGGQREIAMAELAVQRASNANVRAFAQQLVSDHTAMAQKLEQLAASKGLQSEIAEYATAPVPTRPMAVSPSTGSGSPATVGLSADGTPDRTGVNAADYTRGSTAGGTKSAIPSRDVASAPAIDSSRASSDIGLAGAPTGHSSADMAADWNDPTKDRHYKRLAAKTGADFDKAFISAMVDDHEDDVPMFEKKSQNAKDADVKEFASSNLPTLRGHLEKAQSLAVEIQARR